MAYCQRGRELLSDLQRSDFLPAYDDEGVRQVIIEITDLTLKVETGATEVSGGTAPDAIKVGLVYHNTCLRRNLRYMLAFLTHRLMKLRALRWESGAVLPEGLRRTTLSGPEHEYFGAYNKLLLDYCSDAAVGMDLSCDLEPPKDLNVEVRVVAPSLGEIMTDGGPVSLEQGSTHFLRRADVEHLIRQGHVQQFKS